jgi:hypothetical protein
MPALSRVAVCRVNAATSAGLIRPSTSPKSTSRDRPFLDWSFLPPLLMSTWVTTTPSLRRVWRSTLGDSASRTPETPLPLAAIPL